MFIAVDANPAALRPIARQAGRKASRGGVPNLLCLAAAAEALGQTLAGVADRVSVILPWGRLLRTVAEPEPDDLDHLVALGQPGAHFELLFSYEAQIDGQTEGPLGTNGVDEAHVNDNLLPAYALAGLRVKEARRVERAELKAYSSTWAQRLAFGRNRAVWRIRAVRGG